MALHIFGQKAVSMCCFKVLHAGDGPSPGLYLLYVTLQLDGLGHRCTCGTCHRKLASGTSGHMVTHVIHCPALPQVNGPWLQKDPIPQLLDFLVRASQSFAKSQSSRQRWRRQSPRRRTNMSKLEIKFILRNPGWVNTPVLTTPMYLYIPNTKSPAD